MTGPWTHVHSLSPGERLDVLRLLDATEAATGREAIDEGRRRAVVHRWPAEHWLRHDGPTLVGYAIATGSEHTEVEMAGGGFDRELAATVLDERTDVGWWLRGQSTGPECGAIERTLDLLRIDLPVAAEPPPPDAMLRPFRSSDATAWLAQNNAAFADHPVQGAWSARDLDDRLHEPWFDPSGFLLLEIDGRIAASCWTKVHELHPDRYGEIYVVSVDPAYRGRHLGRVMVTQGLAHLAQRGVNEAYLFVEHSNARAQALYAALGFAPVRQDYLVRLTGADLATPR